MRPKILIVEDEAAMASLLVRGLEDQGYDVAVAADGERGLARARQGDFAAIVLDVTLPLLDGYAVASLLRAHRIATPILMLTARDALENIIEGLDAGAEDYMTKPFSFLELLARLRALVRRGQKLTLEAREFADLRLDPVTCEVTRGGVAASLTRTEYKLLNVLMENPGHLVLRAEIIRSVWGAADAIESASLDVFVKALRAKIDRASDKKLIQTVRGFGYKLGES